MNPEPGPEPLREVPGLRRPRRRENALVDWARAIALGIQDTAKDVLEEGRKGAREAYDEYWERFEKKTKHRRTPKPPRS